MPAPPDSDWLLWLDKLGWPLAILIIFVVGVFFGLRRITNWALPHIDRMIEAHVKRQESVAQSMKDLADKTIEIQQANAASIKTMTSAVQNACKWTPPTKK